MNKYIEKLNSFLEQQTPNYGDDDVQSLLEMLHYYYTLANPVDIAVIHCQFKELDDILSKLSLADNNAIFSLTCSICTSHERHAFLEGVHVGLRLFVELGEAKK